MDEEEKAIFDAIEKLRNESNQALIKFAENIKCDMYKQFEKIHDDLKELKNKQADDSLKFAIEITQQKSTIEEMKKDINGIGKNQRIHERESVPFRDAILMLKKDHEKREKEKNGNKALKVSFVISVILIIISTAFNVLSKFI